MINKGEGTKLTESYSWFTDEDVINNRFTCFCETYTATYQ